jgi:uncharacterized protein (TIGR03437 family)
MAIGVHLATRLAMLRILSIILVFQSFAAAQFFGLATPANGSAVYFATPLPQKDTTQSTYGKIFRADASGLHLVLSRDRTPPTVLLPSPPNCNPTNAYSLFGADTSSDGTVTAFAGWRDCVTPDELEMPDRSSTTIITPSGQSDYTGDLKLSANGAWALGFGWAGGAVAYRIDVTGGKQVSLIQLGESTPEVPAGRPIANNGTAVIPMNGQLVIVQDSGTRTIPAAEFAEEAIIDTAATFIVYSGTVCSSPPGPFSAVTSSCSYSLHLTDLNGSSDAVLAANGYSPSMTDDGAKILYLSDRTGTAQAYLINRDGSGDRQITTDPFGLARAVLSGDGSTAYAVSLGGRLLKIAVASATAVETVPRTPFLNCLDPTGGNGFSQAVAPATVVSLAGAGLTDSAVSAGPPLPQSLAGIQATVGGELALIQSVQSTAISVLVPPNIPPTSSSSQVTMQFQAASPSPFAEPVVPVTVSASLPVFLNQPLARVQNQYLLAAHADWSAQIMPASPALPGEIVHAYAVGLGATQPAVAYGAAAPAQEPLARLSPALYCYGVTGTEPMEVLFAGLAPNMAGIYQIDFRVPADAPTGLLLIGCTRTPATQGSSSILYDIAGFLLVGGT